MNSDEIQAFEKETEPLNQAIVWYRINLRPDSSSELKKLLESPEETVNAELVQALRSLDLDLDTELGRSHSNLDLSHSDTDLDLGRSHPDLDLSHPDLDTIQLDSTCQNEIRTLLMELRVPELKRLTKEFEYDIPSNLNKAELIDTLVTMRPTTKSFISKASQKAGAGATPNQNPIHLTLALNKITELAEKLKLLKADQKLPNKYQKSIQRCNALVNKVAKRYLQNSTKLSSKYKSLTDNKQANSQQIHKRQKVKSKHANKQQTDSKFFSQRGGDVWMGVGIGTGVLALFALVALLWRRWRRREATYLAPSSATLFGNYARPIPEEKTSDEAIKDDIRQGVREAIIQGLTANAQRNKTHSEEEYLKTYQPANSGYGVLPAFGTIPGYGNIPGELSPEDLAAGLKKPLPPIPKSPIYGLTGNI